MIIRKLDKNGDWSYGQSESDYLSGEYAVNLDILTKLREWKNDCFFALDNGIDYPTRLGSFEQKNLLDNEVQDVILSSEEVVSILEFNSNLNRDTRVYSFEAKVITVYSDESLTLLFDTEDLIQ